MLPVRSARRRPAWSVDRGLREAVRVAQRGAFPHVWDHEAGPGGIAAGGYAHCLVGLRDGVADEAFGQGHQGQRLQTLTAGVVVAGALPGLDGSFADGTSTVELAGQHEEHRTRGVQ